MSNYEMTPIYVDGKKVGEVYLEKDTLKTMQHFLGEKDALVRLVPNAAIMPEEGVVDILSFHLEIIDVGGY